MKKSKQLVSIIIVNWNGGDVFADCLKSLEKLSYPNWELIVVDNGSSDGSQKLPQNYQLSIANYKLIQNKKNVGFAPANNQGYKKAKGDYILLLNNDTKVTPAFLTKMVTRMEKDKLIGVMQPKIFMMDKPGYLDNAGSFMTSTGFLEHWGYGKKDSKEFSKEREVFTAKGACLLTRKDIIEKVGLFDSDFVSYFEESDFCWRVWLAGWRVLFYPDARIQHKVGFTTERLIPVDINYHSMKNRIATLVKNLEFKNYFTLLLPHLVLVIGLGLLYLIRLQFDKFRMIVKSIWWNVVNIESILEKRNKAQENRVITDEELFKTVMQPIDFRAMFLHFVHTEGNFERRDSNYSFDIPIKGRVRVCLELLRKQKIEGKRVVNVGCSYGWMESVIVKDKMKKIVGVDPDEKAISFAKENVDAADFIIGEANSIPLKDSFADVVTLFDVIEHVPKGTEVEVLKEIKRVLKKNGRLLLSTPNSNLLTNILDPVWYLGHRHYSKGEIETLLRSAGFEIELFEVRGNLLFSFYLVWLYLMKWVFRSKNPRFTILENLDDKSFSKSGIHTIFLAAKKL